MAWPHRKGTLVERFLGAAGGLPARKGGGGGAEDKVDFILAIGDDRSDEDMFLAVAEFVGRVLHSSTFQLNFSALYRIEGARTGCEARVKGVFRVCRVFIVSDTAQVELISGRV